MGRRDHSRRRGLGPDEPPAVHVPAARVRHDAFMSVDTCEECHWPQLKRAIEAIETCAPGGRSISPFYHAPTVIFVSHRKQDLQPRIEWANAACVTLQTHLAATDLGLQSVFSWFALESMRLSPELDRTDLRSLPDGFDPLIGLSVGHGRRQRKAIELPADRISHNRLQALPTGMKHRPRARNVLFYLPNGMEMALSPFFSRSKRTSERNTRSVLNNPHASHGHRRCPVTTRAA